MFLKKLYRHHNLLWLAFAGFVVVQLFINFKQGLTVMPFMHYGMYSGPAKVQPEINVTEIIADGKKIEAADFSAVTWDKVMLPLDLYCRQHRTEQQFYEKDIRRLLGMLKIPTTASTFTNQLEPGEFLKHYTSLLEKIIGKKISDLQILQSRYQYLEIDGQAHYLFVHSQDYFEQWR